MLCEYNQGEFHRKHGRIVGDVLRWCAQELGYGPEADFWEAVGILHDLDFESNLPYASETSGRMHTCSHDFYTTALLGAAERWAQRRVQFPGTVVLLFQPAEKTAQPK